jgi:hypothetical protein
MFLGSRARPVLRADNLTDRLENVVSSTSHSPIGLHGLLRGYFIFLLLLMSISTELNFSAEASSHLATQEFPNIPWTPKVHCHVRKSSQQVPTLNQISSVHITQFYFSNIRLSIIFLPMIRSSLWFLFFLLSH